GIAAERAAADTQGRLARDRLFGGIDQGGAALLAIARGEHAGAQLREPARPRQLQAADLFGRLFLAAGLDPSPVVLANPVPIGQVLHLINLPGLHRASPDSCAWPAGIRSFLATIGLTGVTIA